MKSSPTLVARLAIVAFVLLSCVSSLRAQVLWGGPLDITGDGDVFFPGTYVDAAYFYGGGGNQTINGFNFHALNPVSDGQGGNIWSSTNISFEAADLAFDGVMHGPALANSSSAYQLILASTAYNFGGNPSFHPAPDPLNSHSFLTLNNLTIGTKYQLQIWSNTPSDGNHFRSVLDNSLVLDGGSTVNASGAGQYVIGTFTATSATLTLDLFPDFGGGSNVNGISAVSLQTLPPVPEPSSIALIGLSLGLLAFAARRRLVTR